MKFAVVKTISGFTYRVGSGNVTSLTLVKDAKLGQVVQIAGTGQNGMLPWHAIEFVDPLNE